MGLVNWAESAILPSGSTLKEPENITGSIDFSGWHSYNDRREIEGRFWPVLGAKLCNALEDDMPLIQRANMSGLFCRHGPIAEGKFLKGPMHPAKSSLVYLDAFCTTNI